MHRVHSQTLPTTTARFTCPECNQRVTCEVEVPEVDWNVEPLSDSLSEDDSDMECPSCKTVFSVHIQNSPSNCAIEIYEYPDVEVDADDAPFAGYPETYDDEWLNPSVPDDPYKVFRDTYYHLGDVLAEYGEGGSGPLKHSASLINRMTFAQSVSALEAYLGDTLVNAVMSRPDAMRRLVEKDTELSVRRLSFSEVLDDPKIVPDLVQDYLRQLLYHNLSKISIIYRITLDVEIFPDIEIKQRLFKAMLIRHDIVHRNGKDKSGVEVRIASDEVEQVISDIERFVSHVEKAVKLSAKDGHSTAVSAK